MPDDPRRADYLARFADKEGKEFLGRFYAKYKGKLVMTDPSFTSLQVSVVGTTAKARGWGRVAAAFEVREKALVQGTASVMAYANLAMLAGAIGRTGGGMLPLRGQNNVQGGGDMGALPHRLPGFQDVEDAALRAPRRGPVGAARPVEAAEQQQGPEIGRAHV